MPYRTIIPKKNAFEKRKMNAVHIFILSHLFENRKNKKRRPQSTL
ncbi:hypothetical protein HMPREF1992_01816 [Selenomonas sp. oral taxon 892 str. F0426]|nr:hypothetical protein HMPREF1992_01816 [Selenomonas sp. oral taxon 892 str. F0426]